MANYYRTTAYNNSDRRRLIYSRTQMRPLEHGAAATLKGDRALGEEDLFIPVPVEDSMHRQKHEPHYGTTDARVAPAY